MRKILCICNTYYQLIVSVQLALTIFENDEVSVALSDHSRNSDKILNNLCESQLYKKVFYIRTKNISKGKIEKLVSYTFGNDKIWDSLDLDVYDEFIYFSEGYEIYSLFAKLYKKNNNVIASRYEEGIFSYGHGVAASKSANVAASLRHFKTEKSLSDAYGVFYCFYPELYHGIMSAVQIPAFGINSIIAEKLRQIFDFELSDDEYKQKFIYFSSVYDFEGGEPIGEFELVKRIRDIVGNENLLVKIHPRDNIDKYVSEGLTVDKNSAIPWEAIQLTKDFSSHVFLTATSGAAISSSLLLKQAPRVFYLYKMCNIGEGNAAAAQTVQDIKDILATKALSEKLKRVHVPMRMSEIIE